jgi:hypothetical protein
MEGVYIYVETGKSKIRTEEVGLRLTQGEDDERKETENEGSKKVHGEVSKWRTIYPKMHSLSRW